MKYRRQPRYVGGRQPVTSGFIPDLEKAVRREMRKFNVSRSFVIATCVAYALGVEEQPDYARPVSKSGVIFDFPKQIKA